MQEKGFGTTSLEKRISSAVERAEMILVKDQESLEKANYFLRGIKDLMKEIDDHHDEVIILAKQTHLKAVQKKRDMTGPLYDAIDLVKPKVSGYLAKERQREAEEEEKRQKIINDQKELESKAIMAATKAAEDGRIKEAEKIIEKAAEKERGMAPIPKVHKAPEVKGLHLRKNWKYRIKNQALLCKERPDLMIPDHPTIGKLVRAMKEKTDIPGVEAYSEDSTIQR